MDDLTDEMMREVDYTIQNFSATEILALRAVTLSPIDVLTIKLSSDEDDAFIKLAADDLDRSPRKNWVENVGGLPKYILEVARSLHRKRGMTIQRAIQTAVAVVRRWASGAGNVDPDTRAKAAKAIAEWDAKRARAKAKPNK